MTKAELLPPWKVIAISLEAFLNGRFPNTEMHTACSSVVEEVGKYFPSTQHSGYAAFAGDPRDVLLKRLASFVADLSNKLLFPTPPPCHDLLCIQLDCSLKCSMVRWASKTPVGELRADIICLISIRAFWNKTPHPAPQMCTRLTSHQPCKKCQAKISYLNRLNLLLME